MSSIVLTRRRALDGLGEGLATGFALLSVASLFLLSSMMLTMLGIDYETAGGSPLSKIHPATYFAVLACGAWMVSRLDPVGAVAEALLRHPGTALFLLALVVLVLQIVLVQRTPFTMVLDTFVLPVMLLILLTRVSASALRGLAVFIHAVMIVNALLGLAEFVSGWRLTPLVAGGVELTSDWRSTALLGHPLANASITAGYVLALMLGGGRDLPSWLRLGALLIQLPAMAVFGGRAAIVLLLAFASIIAGLHAFRTIARGAIRPLEVAAVCFLVPVAAIGVVVLATSGFFDRFLERFVSDDGSAESRISMMHLIAQIPTHELFFGPDPVLVATLQRLEGIEFGIESFWVGMVAYYGLIVAGIVFAGLFAFLRDVWRASAPESLWILAFFIIVCSTSASLSGKTTSFAVTVAMVLALLPRDSRRAAC